MVDDNGGLPDPVAQARARPKRSKRVRYHAFDLQYLHVTICAALLLKKALFP